MTHFVNSAFKPPTQRGRSWIKQAVVGAVAAACLGGLALSPAIAQDKTIVWGKNLEATLLDPHTSVSGSSWEILHTIYDGLTDLDADTNVIPALAESWTQPNPTTYVFTLRQGVRFSNGREMTADDVVGSLQRVLDPSTGSFFRLQLGKVKSVSSSDARTVTIELEEPYAPLIKALSSTMASILPMKELNDGSLDLNKDTLGTGPFMVESHASGDNWVLVRNPHYWEAGLPVADKLIVRIIPTDQALVAALRAGTIDIGQFDSSPDAPRLLQRLDNVEVITSEQSSIWFMLLNAIAEDSPFSNQLVRRAFALAMDRNEIIEFALGGNGRPSGVLAPMFDACDTSKLPLFTRDVERAKALLKEAGVEGFSFDMLIVPDGIQEEWGSVVKRNLAEIGVTVNLVSLDEGTWIKRIWIDNPGTFVAATAWYAGYSDPAMLPLWWIPEDAGFVAGYQVEDAALIAEIRNMRSLDADDPKRAEALQTVCEMIDNQANQIAISPRVVTMAYRSDRIDASLIRHTNVYINSVHDVERYTPLQ